MNNHNTDYVKQNEWQPRMLALLCMIVALTLITSTYHVYDQTWDEPDSIACGMQWLEYHHFNYDPVDPPLSEIMEAAGPYFIYHARLPKNINDAWKVGTVMLEQGGYDRLLTAARIGNLPFFIFSVFLIWRYARKYLGEWPATIAVLSFCTCEPILANSGLAVRDMALVPFYFLSVNLIWEWLEHPNLRLSIYIGLSVAFACLSKLTAIPFLLFFLLLIVLLRFNYHYRATSERHWNIVSRYGNLTLISILFCVLTIWAFYWFSVGSVFPVTSAAYEQLLNSLSTFHVPKCFSIFIFNHMPAYEFFLGIRSARSYEHRMLLPYYLGSVRNFRYGLYPLSIICKTPIAMLFLGVSGAWVALRRQHMGDRYGRLLLVGMIAPVLTLMSTHTGLGIRHELVIYPFLAILSALAVYHFWATMKGRIAVVLLLLWQVVACGLAWPDYLPYFNEATASHASYFLAGSDLDWAQDLKRLGPALTKLHADHITISYNGSDDLNRMGLPPWQIIQPQIRPHGWVVISLNNILWYGKEYDWLRDYHPVKIVGHSMYIYYIP